LAEDRGGGGEAGGAGTVVVVPGEGGSCSDRELLVLAAVPVVKLGNIGQVCVRSVSGQDNTSARQSIAAIILPESPQKLLQVLHMASQLGVHLDARHVSLGNRGRPDLRTGLSIASKPSSDLLSVIPELSWRFLPATDEGTSAVSGAVLADAAAVVAAVAAAMR
jgi:hypothetical protein